MKSTQYVLLVGFFLFNSSCGLIDGELFRPTGQADLDSTPPPSPSTSSDTWGYWNTSADLIKAGSYVISGGARGLSVFNFSTPYSPTLENNILNDSIRNISKNGNHAFVSYSNGRFEVLDISDPLGPVLLSSVTLTAPRRALVNGSYIYVPDAASGIRILDFSDPDNVSITNTVDTSGTAESVKIAGGYLYVADKLDLKIYDLTAPTAPNLLGTYNPSGDVTDVEVQGNYAFVANLWEGIDVVDISNKASPSLAGTYTDGDYFQTGFRSLQIVGNHLLAKEEDYGGLKSFDISTPTSPQLVSQIHPGTDLYNDSYHFITDGNYAYVAFGGRGVKAVDISDLDNIYLPYSFMHPAFVGYAFSVAITGNYAYVCENYDGRFYIFDISTPSRPVMLNSPPTLTCSHEMLIDGNYLYALDQYTSGGLAIFDITTPTAPAFVGDVAITSPRRLEKSGSYVYVVRNNNAVEVVDVSNPATPSIVNSVAGTHTDIVLEGNYAYVTGTTTLKVLDITNPLSIPAAVSLNVGTPTISSYRITKSGNHVYLSGSDQLVSIDVTNPASPTHSQTIAAVRTLNDFTVINSKLYGCHAYYGIWEFDITNPAAVFQTIAHDTGQCIDLTNSGGRIYSADQASGFKILDFSIPHSLTRSDSLSRYSGSGIQISGNLSFLVNGEYGVQIFDIDDPKNPTPLAAAKSNYVDSLFVFNDTLFIGDDYGVFIFDVTSPSTPSLLSRTKKVGGNLNGFAVSGTTLYSAEGGLVVYDISAPSSPSHITTLAGAASNTPVAIGNRLYVADGSDGFRIFDISTPTAPTQLGLYNSPGFAYHVLIDGNYAYIADGTAGLRIVDISNPAAPSSVGQYDTPGTSYRLAKQAQYIYIADYTGGIQIVDVSTPASPTLKTSLSSTTVRGNPQSVAISGTYLHISNGSGTYEIFDISDIDDIHQ